jgi:5-guanidino-2-oxopentanoate decarboxylase
VSIASSAVTEAQSSTAAQLAVETLARLGIDTVFGIPGVHNQGLYDALIDVPRIRSVVTRHEQGAGFMADGYARSSGRVGVSFVITGAGLTNASTAIAESFSDSVPTVFVVTCYERERGAEGRRLHELRDQGSVLSGLFKRVFKVTAPADLPGAIVSAAREAIAGRPGPVAVEVPIEYLDVSVDSPTETAHEVDRGAAPRLQQTALPVGLEAWEGKNPVLVVGGGSVEAAPEVTSLAERLGAIVITTAAGKGVAPDSHPLVLGAWLKAQAAKHLVSRADPLILLGTEWSTTDRGEGPYPLPERVVSVNIDHRDTPEGVLRVHGDVATVLRQLLAQLPERAADLTRTDEVHKLKQEVRAEPRRWPALALECLDIMASVLPADAIIVHDMNTLSYAAVERFPTSSPRQFLFPRGYGTLGYALPAAIGASLANPYRTTVAVAGDGGFLFTAEELATAVRHRLRLPVVIWNNASFGAIRATRTAAYERSIDDDLTNPDFVALAQAFGAFGIRVDSAAGLAAALKGAMERPGPTVIDVKAY